MVDSHHERILILKTRTLALAVVPLVLALAACTSSPTIDSASRSTQSAEPTAPVPEEISGEAEFLAMLRPYIAADVTDDELVSYGQAVCDLVPVVDGRTSVETILSFWNTTPFTLAEVSDTAAAASKTLCPDKHDALEALFTDQ